MKQQFKDVNFRTDSIQLVHLANEIINQYQGQGLRLTLRQLYYQFVTRNAIRNEEKSYKRLGNIISDARLAGLIDWDAIEDRVRVPRLPNQFDDLQELADAALRAYKLPRWNGQDYYIELWVEKDALSGVLAPMATQYHVTLMVNRGYSSQSAMYEAANRFLQNSTDSTGTNKLMRLLYLGDHDPSGEDMVRDIRDRLEMFGVNVDVEKVALNMNQVEQYNPPPNPAKLTDTRANGYIAKFGDQSWEVDALPPDVLHSLIENKILEYLDVDKMNAIKDKEKRDKVRLQAAVKNIMESEEEEEDQG